MATTVLLEELQMLRLKVLVVVAMLFMTCCVKEARATDWTGTISRGGTLVCPMADGDTWTVYYNPDGTFPTLSVWEPAGYWALLASTGQKTPVTPYAVYIRSARTDWQQVGGGGAWPFVASMRLYGAQGTQYKILFKNYQHSTPVYLSVQ